MTAGDREIQTPCISRAIIVHPLWRHTLTDPPFTRTQQSRTWTSLPREVLLLIASHLGAKDVCNLQATNRELRWVFNEIHTAWLTIPALYAKYSTHTLPPLSLCAWVSRVLAQDEAVWRALCNRTFDVPERPHPPPSWRGLYIFNHRALIEVFYGNEQTQEAPTPAWMPRGRGSNVLIQARLG